MKALEYTELIIFKSGDTSLKTAIMNVVGQYAGHYETFNAEVGEKLYISPNRVDSGPEFQIIHPLHRHVNQESIAECYADVRSVD